MTKTTVVCAGVTPAINFARQFLQETGIAVTEIPHWDIGHLLLDVPSFRTGLWTEETLGTLLSSLPRNVVIWGGNLDHPALESFHKIDLLKDEIYLAENAAITARCTLPIVESLLKQPWPQTAALIIGWGRISKRLAPLLQEKGCPVSIISRNDAHRKEILSLGYIPVDPSEPGDALHDASLLINTAPATVLAEKDAALCSNCTQIDLASRRGLSGDNVVWARALPGRYAPEESGKLIAQSFLRIRKELAI